MPTKIPNSNNFFCPSCNGKLIEKDNTFICPCDKIEHRKPELVKKGCFYLFMSIAEQLKVILECFDVGKYTKRIEGRSSLGNVISDICDGQMYSEFSNRRKGEYAISLLGSTDGVVTFETTSTSLWPVQFIVLELPPYERKKYPIVSSLWFAKGKPNCNALLREFCEEVKELSNKGFVWKRGEEFVTSTVDLLGFCCDAVARAPVQNFTQFNGYFGCSWCEHSGSRVENRNVYHYKPNATNRTKESVERNALEANKCKHSVKGVKGFSILSLILSTFDIIRGIVFDSMHCVDLGVMKQRISLWFDSKYSAKPWYLGSFISSQINQKLSNIIPPSNVSRLPGNLISRSTWKTSEWRNLLLYYGMFIFKGFLPEEFYNHFLLLTTSIYLLNKKKITLEEFYRAKTNLELFV
jgi:hypothetical protein